MSHENGTPASVSLEAQLRARDSAALRDLARRAWPLGARGQWPVLFPQLLEHERLQELLAIPGVVAHGGAQVRCTADAAPVVARELGVPCPPLQLDELVESWESEAYLYPGRDEWHRLGLSDKLRPYQVEDAFFAARRSMVLNCNPARSGKIAETYATAVLRGVPRLLILCPDIAKWGWAEDAAKFLNQDAAILYGRSARIARGLCLTCNSGRPTDLAPGQVRGPDGQPVRCPRCLKFDGTSDGFWRVELRARACKGHAWKGEGVCPGCQDDFDSRLLRSRAVIANYDILTPHKVRDAAGKVHFPAHLAGVPARLRRVNFGSVVLDEGHELRGWTRAAKKINRNTRDYVRELIRGIPVCEIVTATPMMSGYVRDLVSLLDLVSDGAMIDGPSRRQFKWLERYAGAVKGDFGLLDKGTSDLALTELPERLSMFTIRRDRSVIQPYLPRVMPRIVYLEKSAERPRAPSARNQRINVAQFDATANLRDDAAAGFEERELGALNAKAEKKYAKIVRETILDKVAPVCNDARLEMLEGRKVLIFTWAKSSLFLIRKQLLATMASDQYRHGFEAVNARVFCAHSDNSSGEERRNWGKQFTKHEGAAAFLTTHDSFQVGASLQGATLVCVAELHYNADAMNQSLSRPMEGNAESIAYNFYVVRDSPDETMVKKVLPKISTAASVTGDKTTSTFFAAFEDEKPKMPATLDEMINMLTAGIDFSHGDLNAWSDDDGGLDDSED